MAQRRLLMSLLIAATTLVDLWLAVPLTNAAADASGMLAERWLFVLVGLAMSQVSFLGVLAAWGAVPLPWGLTGIVLMSVCASRLARSLEVLTSTRQTTIVELALLTSALIAIVLTWIVRPAGMRFVTLEPSGAPNGRTERPRFQFTLGRMFAWITSTAVILGVVRYTMHYETIRTYSFWYKLFEFSLINSSLPAFVGVWAVLGARRLARGFALFSLTTLFALGVDGGHIWGDFSMAPFFVLPQFVWLLAATVVLRVAGYRIVRRGGPTENTSGT